FNAPTVKGKGRLLVNQPGEPHLLGPGAIVCRDDELRIRELLLEQLTELLAVARIDRHNDIVEQGKRKALGKQSFHQGEVKADSHAVLMPLAVIGNRREQTSIIKVHFKTKAALGWRKLRRKFRLVIIVNCAVVRAEILLDFTV